MAKLDLKICFVYGAFGFGNSRRINFDPDAKEDDIPQNIEEQLLLSLFPRYKPPAIFADDKLGGGISVVPDEPSPDVLPSFQSEDEPQASKFKDQEHWREHPNYHLMAGCDRLHHLRNTYLSCDTYYIRKMFLEKLILHDTEMTMEDVANYKAKKTEMYDNLEFLRSTSLEESTLHEEVFDRRLSSTVDINDISKLLYN